MRYPDSRAARRSLGWTRPSSYPMAGSRRFQPLSCSNAGRACRNRTSHDKMLSQTMPVLRDDPTAMGELNRVSGGQSRSAASTRQCPRERQATPAFFATRAQAGDPRRHRAAGGCDASASYEQKPQRYGRPSARAFRPVQPRRSHPESEHGSPARTRRGRNQPCSHRKAIFSASRSAVFQSNTVPPMSKISTSVAIFVPHLTSRCGEAAPGIARRLVADCQGYHTAGVGGYVHSGFAELAILDPLLASLGGGRDRSVDVLIADMGERDAIGHQIVPAAVASPPASVRIKLGLLPHCHRVCIPVPVQIPIGEP